MRQLPVFSAFSSMAGPLFCPDSVPSLLKAMKINYSLNYYFFFIIIAISFSLAYCLAARVFLSLSSYLHNWQALFTSFCAV